MAASLPLAASEPCAFIHFLPSQSSLQRFSFFFSRALLFSLPWVPPAAPALPPALFIPSASILGLRSRSRRVFPGPTEVRLSLLLSCRSGGWGTAFSCRGGGGRANELPALSRARAVSILHPRTIALTSEARSPRDSAAPNANGSVPARPDSSCSPPPLILPGPTDTWGLPGEVWGMRSPVSPHLGACRTPGDSGARAGGTGTSVVQRHPEHPELGLPPVHAPGEGWGGCDSSIWSSPDLLTKAELFLKSSHSAKFASAARPAAAARRRG